MANTGRGRRLTEQHRQAQIRLGAVTVARITQLWPLLDPAAITDTVPAWLDATTQVVATQHAASAALARRYYQTFRTIELGDPLGGTLPTPGLADEAVRRSLIVTGPVRIERATRRNLPLERAIAIARTETARAAHRHTLGGGRETIARIAATDPRSGGWSRITSGNACDFCTMLATRGAVYSATTVDFQAHDGCSCTSEPAWR